MAMANTSAYYDRATMTIVKCFMIQDNVKSSNRLTISCGLH